MEIRRSTPAFIFRFICRGFLSVVAGALFLHESADGQEALRSAVEGDRNLQNRIQQSNSEVDAPFTLGPVQMTVGLRLDLTYTDNSANSGLNPQEDFIITPNFNIGLFYQITDSSRLSFGVGLGYEIYVEQTREDRLLITPNSELAYDFRAGNTLVTLYDRISYSSDALDRGDLVNRSDYGGIENTVGIRALYSPEPVYLEGGYSHFNFWSTQSDTLSGRPAGLGQLDRASEQLFFRVGQIIAESTRWGVETSGSYIHYDVPLRSNLYQLSLGPYLQWQITEAWNLTGRVGWSWTEFEQTGTVPAPDDISAPYLGLNVSHQWTDNFRHNWSATREVSTGVETQILERFVFNYGLNWQVTELLGFRAGAYYEIGEQPGLIATEDYDYYGFNFGFPFAITERFGAAVSYEYRDRVSNIPGQSFDENRVTLSLSYQF